MQEEKIYLEQINNNYVINIETQLTKLLEYNGYSENILTQSHVDLVTDKYVQCCNCKKWRGLTLKNKGNHKLNGYWVCCMNNDSNFNDCDIPSEMCDADIDNEISVEQKMLDNGSFIIIESETNSIIIN